jgi:tetratricopeptide (TPR) repeat protein
MATIVHTNRRPAQGVRWLAALAVAATGLLAQAPSPLQIVKGQVEQEGGGTRDGQLMVELADPFLQRQPKRQLVRLGGEFEFPMVESGQYELRLTNLGGDVIRREFVSIGESSGRLTIRLPQRSSSEPLHGVVSVVRLRRHIPAKAAREFHRAEGAGKQGDISASIQHLESAIRIEPAYMEAHNNLGSRYVFLGDCARAEAEFRTAAELDPSAVLPQANLSAVFLNQRRYADAETAARQALALNRGSRQAAYVLGLALEAQGKERGEAIESLRRASGQFPNSRLAAARILCRQGAVAEAISELGAYLRTPDVPERRLAEDWLASLKALNLGLAVPKER